MKLLNRGRLRAGLVAASSVAAGFALVAVAGTPPPPIDPLATLKAQFRRPKSVPHPPGPPPTTLQIELGKRLFSEPRLSLDDTVSCASCHDPALAFADGAPLGSGVARVPLPRHTPALWNLAWSYSYFWDGRADTLEQQVRGPIENPKEMGQSLRRGIEKLRAGGDYAGAFAAAFPADPAISETSVSRALATYVRTIISPPTRFDAWIDGDEGALSLEEQAGFLIFTGKAACSRCHSGWSFTDHAFHDIGLPGEDLGRGPVAGLPSLNHAFKTPGLRELAWTAPYMHDGSLATLDDVVRHYERGGVARQTRSPDLPPGLDLTDTERERLIAFLESLSSTRPPRPSTDMAHRTEAGPARPTAVPASVVTQKDKQFAPASVALRLGETLTIVNDDTRPHNVRVFDPRMSFNSGVQEPGDTATLSFTAAGTFEAFCGIHPSMRLSIEVR